MILNKVAAMNTSGVSCDSLIARFELIPKHVNADLQLVHRGKWLTADIIVVIGTVRFLLRVENGKLIELTRQFALFHACDLFIQGTLQAWEKFWMKEPPPGWHDIFSLHKRGEMVVEGDTQKFFANLQYLKDVFEMPRHFDVKT